MINRKKSVEKVNAYQNVGGEQPSPNGGGGGGGGGQAPYQIYKHSNGKIELRSISNNNGGAAV